MPRSPALSRTPWTDDASDAELAAAAVDGDKAAFAVIMRRHNRLLFRTARSILKSDTEAEDALQEAYLRAWRGLAGFRAEARLSTWLVRIVANEALGRLRQPDARVVSLDAVLGSPGEDVLGSLADEPDRQPPVHAMRAQLRRLLEERIDVLPAAYRSVFVLRAVEEMNVEEVAQALGIPEATVRTRYFRARSLLREGLARDIDMTLGDAFAFDGARCDRIVEAVLPRLQR